MTAYFSGEVAIHRDLNVDSFSILDGVHISRDRRRQPRILNLSYARRTTEPACLL